MLLHNGNLKEIHKFCQIVENFPKIWQNIFGSIENIFFEKVEKKIRPSISKQNFTADRMGALSASENHSKA